MTNEERDLIARFVARVGGAAQSGGFLPGQGGSVPQSQPALPPIDREADSFISDQFQRYPEARYRITQMAVVQEAALAEMNNRLTQLQWELEQARQQQAQPQQSRGLFSGLFGGGASQPAPQQRGNPWGNAGAQQQGGQQQGGQPGYGRPQYAPPPPQYSPGYRPGMFGGGGSGFLGSALTTAAGVAGGMVVGNALMNAFSGHHGVGEAAAAPLGGAGGFLGGADPATTAFDGSGVIPAADPTAGFGGDQFGGGATGFDDPGVAPDAGFDSGGFDDASGGGGFDSGGFDNS